MTFKKYSSIENSYHDKHVMYFLKAFPALKNEMYILREKLDGANVQFYFTPDGDASTMKVGKRTSFLTPGAGFYDIWNTIERYKAEFGALQQYSTTIEKPIRVFGEIYGPGINGRVDYGPEKKIATFDIYTNEILLTQVELDCVADYYNFKHMLAPKIRMIEGLENALDFNPEFTSAILNEDGNYAEGFVMQPYRKIYRTGSGERFLLKKKGEKFKEKETKNKGPKIKQDLHPNIIRLVGMFNEYVNENRVLSVFSKHGPIESPKQIGKYIVLVLEDAKEDFYKDNPDIDLDKMTAKIVFNSGKTIVDILKKHL